MDFRFKIIGCYRVKGHEEVNVINDSLHNDNVERRFYKVPLEWEVVPFALECMPTVKESNS